MFETSTPYTPASTSTSVTGNETVTLANEIKKYDTVKLIEFLMGQEDLQLDDDDLEIIKKRKINGRAFLKITKEDLERHGMELGPASNITDFAKELEKKNETIEVYCTASYGNKKAKPFQWTVTREMVTLVGLKKILFECEDFDFPDGTEYDHLVINRVIGGGQKRRISDAKKPETKPRNSSAKLDVTKSEDLKIEVRRTIRLSTNEDLASIICTSGPNVNLEITVDTPQQPFSSYTFSRMKVLFGLQYDDYDDLPEHKLFYNKVNDSFVPKEVLEDVIREILRKHTASRPIRADVNEATRREFISAIIYGVASTFKGVIKIFPEHQVSGSHGKGPIDWIIKIGDIIICVTEAKRNDISHGIGQSTVQAHASMKLNNKNKKRTYDDADLNEDEMYCIVSTGAEWVITRVVQKRDNGKLEVYRCTPMPEPIPINRLSLTRDDLYNPVRNLLALINEFFLLMEGVVDKSEKRAKLSE